MNTSKPVEVIAVNLSEQKGTIKQPVPFILLDPAGVTGDAHAGPGLRQVSLLGAESIEKFGSASGRTFEPGEFAENITTRGMNLFEASPLDRFTCGDLALEVTQIGKKCHGSSCAIFRETGDCVMPKEGIFCRVVTGGELKPGDLLTYRPHLYKAMIITLSDRAYRGEYEDKSGPAAGDLLAVFCREQRWQLSTEYHIIPDDPELLRNLLFMGEDEGVDFIFTTGGTGIGPRDITPDVMIPLLDKEIPGIMDQIRLKYGQEKRNALLTRSVCGVMRESLVFALPGSERAVREYMVEILPSLRHMKAMLHGLDSH